MFLVNEKQLKELLRFCMKCGAAVEDVTEVKNKGSQHHLRVTCSVCCRYDWKFQPDLKSVKGLGNLSVTAGITFAGTFSSKRSYNKQQNCVYV